MKDELELALRLTEEASRAIHRILEERDFDFQPAGGRSDQAGRHLRRCRYRADRA